MLPRRGRFRQARRAASAPNLPDKANTLAKLPLVDEADDVLHGAHGFRGDGAGAVAAVDQDLIDISLIVAQALHLGGDRGELCNSEIDQVGLEAGKLRAAELAQ